MDHLFLFESDVCLNGIQVGTKFAVPAKSQEAAKTKLAAFLAHHVFLPKDISDWKLSIAGRVATDIYVL